MTTTTARELAQLDPRTLVIGTNARIDVRIDAELVESIKEHGVIEPIIGHRDEEGRVIVRAGQRRTLAAVEAEVTTVPVFITEAPADDAARIIEQVEENDRRQAMTGTDRVNVAAELALLGLTPSQIAKRTKRDRAEVDAALAVAHSDASRARIAEGLDLFSAAALAEFEGDDEATRRIEQQISWGHDPAHIVAQIRRNRAAADLIAQHAAELDAQGVRVIDQPERWPGYGPKPTTAALSELMDKDGEGWGHRAEAHAQVCKGHAVWLASDGETVTETVGCEEWRSHGHKPYSTTTGSTQSTEERRAVIEGNKAWLAAAEVRREFVQGIAKAPKAPKGAERFVTKSIACGNVADAAAWYKLRGVKMPELWPGKLDTTAACRALSNLSAAKLTVANLAMVMGHYEARIHDKNSWRHYTHPDVAEYLTTLQGWGYTLSEAEASYVERAAEQTRTAQTDDDAEAEQDDE